MPGDLLGKMLREEIEGEPELTEMHRVAAKHIEFWFDCVEEWEEEDNCHTIRLAPVHDRLMNRESANAPTVVLIFSVEALMVLVILPSPCHWMLCDRDLEEFPFYLL